MEMVIINKKRNPLKVIAICFGAIMIFIGIVELALMGLETIFEDLSIIFFSSPGDAVFETKYIDHLFKAFVSFVIGAIFLYAYPKIRSGSLDGFGFLVGGAILILGVGLLYISVWMANLIDSTIIGLVESEVWTEYSFLDGIRIEWFLAIASIGFFWLWKKKDLYLK